MDKAGCLTLFCGDKALVTKRMKNRKVTLPLYFLNHIKNYEISKLQISLLTYATWHYRENCKEHIEIITSDGNSKYIKHQQQQQRRHPSEIVILCLSKQCVSFITALSTAVVMGHPTGCKLSMR